MPDPIIISPRAAAHIRMLMPGPDAGLRIGLKKGGCAGMEYTMEVVNAAEPADIEVLQDGARVLVAPLAQMFLLGTEVDFKTGLLESGFTFRNPNVAEACGCGESVSFKIER